MTKPRRSWNNKELGKPIRMPDLPRDQFTHGGAIAEENAEAFNKAAREKIENAIYAALERKLPLLSQEYSVKHQNYKGLVVALGREFIRGFNDNIEDLRNEYNGASNKELAIILAAQYVRGFQFDPGYIKPDFADAYCNTETNDVHLLISGPIWHMLAEGRPQIWTDEKLKALKDAVSDIKKKGKATTDREALYYLTTRPSSSWRSYSLEGLESRLQDAKNLQNRKKPKARKSDNTQ